MLIFTQSTNMAFDVTLVCQMTTILIFLGSITCLEDLKITSKSIYMDDNWYFQMIEPEQIGYTYKIRPAKDFGGVLDFSYVDIDLVLAQPIHACSSITNGLILKNNIAFIERGGCSFMTKSLQAEAVGAVAIVICDHDQENDQRMIDMVTDGTERTVDIPAFFLLGKDGYMIKKTLTELHLQSAVINIPINATGVPRHLLNMPPWTLW